MGTSLWALPARSHNLRAKDFGSCILSAALSYYVSPVLGCESRQGQKEVLLPVLPHFRAWLCFNLIAALGFPGGNGVLFGLPLELKIGKFHINASVLCLRFGRPGNSRQH